jgi:hypothetical protein
MTRYVEYPALDTKGIIRDDPKMDQGEISMISIEQIRAARGLLGWSQTELAEAANRSLVTIKRLERDDAEGPVVSDDVRDAVQKAFEKAGVGFITENGGGAGVRLAKRGKPK